MWFSLRIPLVFSQRQDAVDIKRECEDAIEWCLEVMRSKRKVDKEKEKKRLAREELRKARERESASNRSNAADDMSDELIGSWAPEEKETKEDETPKGLKRLLLAT